MQSQNNLSRAILLSLAAGLIATSGCGFASHLTYWIYGNKVDAAFTGLDKKKIAVVCLDANSFSGPGDMADALARTVNLTLAKNVPEATVVSQSQVNDWIDSQDREITDYRDIGRGLKTDMVVGVDLERFSIHDGQTLLRGRARVSVRVYDMKQGGKVVYETPTRDIVYPETGGRPITDNEGEFNRMFVSIVAQKIAKDFYAYDKLEDFGLDAAFHGN